MPSVVQGLLLLPRTLVDVNSNQRNRGARRHDARL